MTDRTTTGPVRLEHDSLGEVPVPADRLWGAQTQRSIQNFPIGVERFRWGRPVDPRARHRQEVLPRSPTASSGTLPPEKVDLIVRAAEEVIDGQLRRASSRWWSSRPGRARSRT